MATKSSRVSTRRNRLNDNKAQSVADNISASYDLMGSILTLGSRTESDKRSYLYSDIVKALTDQGFDPKVAKALSPANAFSRAANKMREDRLIDIVREDKDEILFQFSKKHHKEGDEGAELEYKKETMVRLDKQLGTIHCKNKDIKQRAEDELARAMENRTNTDVTNVATKLFEQNSELMRIPGAIGTYFVPREHAEHADKVVAFLRSLGRKPFCFPVPSGSKVGDQSVQEVVESHLGDIVNELNTAIEGFTIQTRGDAISNTAEKIKTTRVNVEAYAHYLGEMAKELLEKVDLANEELTKKIEQLTEDRKEAIAKKWNDQKAKLEAEKNNGE